MTTLSTQLREAAGKATPGPWEAHGDFVRDQVGLRVANCYADWKPDERGRTDDDAVYIALANPANILALLDRLERQQKLLKECAARMGIWETFCSAEHLDIASEMYAALKED